MLNILFATFETIMSVALAGIIGVSVLIFLVGLALILLAGFAQSLATHASHT